MELHENQIMDNLVRAKKGLPILHLDYVNMTGTVTHTGGVTGGGSQTVASNSFFNIPAAAAAMSRVVTGVGNLSATGQQVNQLTITAQPVVNAPEVYAAYLSFLKNADHLREGPCPPSCEEAVIVRCYDGGCDDRACCGSGCLRWYWHKHDRSRVYYWVPREYADDFRQLCLYAVAVRGQPAAAPQNFEATVQGVLPKKIDEDVYELFVKIDRRVPNDSGYLIAGVGGRLYQDRDSLKILINTTGGLKRAQPGTVLEPDQQTDEVRVSVSLKTLGIAKVEDLVKGLAGQRIGVRLDNFVPTGSPVDRALQDIRSQTELFRLNQQLQFNR